jgi:hypothetical protein
MALHQPRLLIVVVALLQLSNAVVSCYLNSQTQVPWFTALKPPESYALHVVAWLNNSFVSSDSSLTNNENPIVSTLRPIFENEGAQYLGALACSSRGCTYLFLRNAKLILDTACKQSACLLVSAAAYLVARKSTVPFEHEEGKGVACSLQSKPLLKTR